MPELHLAPNAALPLQYLNRHALIAGATGTGKTVTLAAMVEGLGRAGVPCLVIDAKGDLESLGAVACPYGERGFRAPLDLFQLGPEIMGRALDLSEAQSGALYVLWELAEARGFPLADLDDLRRLITFAMGDLRGVSEAHGLVGAAALAALQRALLRLESGGAGRLGAFGSPGFDMAGRSGVTVWAAARMARTPALYAAAVTWVLLDLFHRAPERGDQDRPALAVFIDEAHMVFEGTPAPLLRRLEAVARLIRSKGVALIWATQSPADLPPAIAGQCLTRVQHGLRAATPAQLRDVRAAAESLPQPIGGGFDAVAAILGLGVGEALVSLPDDRGMPQPAQLVRITPGRIKPRPKPAPWPTPVASVAFSPTGSGEPREPWGLRTEALPISPTGSGWKPWGMPMRFLTWTAGIIALAWIIG